MELECPSDSSINILESRNRQISVNLSSAYNRVYEESQKNKIKDPFFLKKVLKKHKVQRLIKNFINKISRKLSSRKIPNRQYQQINEENSILKCLKLTNGIQLHQMAKLIWAIGNIFQLTCIVYIISIITAFPQTIQQSYFFNCRVVSIMLYTIDMVLNFTVQQNQMGQKTTNIYDIGKKYIQSNFIPDFLSIILSSIGLLSPSQWVTSLNLIIALVKLWNNITIFEKYQYLFLNSKEKEYYYGLIKVFLTNFLIGHFLSFFLNLLPELNNVQNWHIKLGIKNEQWFIKYIWGYYWGTNIMLTVGFGDLSATNHLEALCLIFIQTFSCITLAYNISYVGSLIMQGKAANNIKKKHLKIFNQMSKQNQIQPQLKQRTINFIQQNFHLKQTFQFDEQDELLQTLPKQIKSDYRKQANKILFSNVGFIKNFSMKTLLVLAQTVQRKITHPYEIVKRKGQHAQFMILQKGQLAFSCRSTKSQLTGKNMRIISIKQKDNPKILSLDFIKNREIPYDIRSINYGVLYLLNRQNFIKNIRDIQIDFEIFCLLKDRQEYILDQYQIYKCQQCINSYHSRFNCPNMHFIPLKSHIILVYLHGQKKKKQSRQFYPRQYNKKSRSLCTHSRAVQDNIKFLKQYYKKQCLDEGIMRKHKTLQLMETFNKQNSILFKQIIQKSKTSDELVVHKLTQVQEKIDSLLKTRQQYRNIWQLQCDEGHSFRYYFTNYNAQNISNNYKRLSN